MTKQNEIIQFYDKFAEKYDDTILKEKDYTAYVKIPSWILEVCKTPCKILDLGCGTGLSSQIFFEKKFLVTGIDISPKMIEKAKMNPFQALHCQSLESPLPFLNHSFDAVVMIGVMEFIQDPHRLFLEIKRVLKENGWFGITIPKKLPKKLEKKLEILTYPKKTIETLFRDSGFHIEKQEEFQGFIYLEETVTYFGYLLTNIV